MRLCNLLSTSVLALATATIVTVAITATTASAVEIYGKVYRWDTLDVFSNAVVEIKNGGIQRLVSENGSYSFNVPPGNYTIVAYYGEYFAVENVTVLNTTRFDLILFPKLEGMEEVLEIPEFPAVDEERSFPYYLYAILISGVIIAVLFLLKYRQQHVVETAEVTEKTEETATEYRELPEDLAKIVEIIKREGGRITQKELRKRLGYSEAKMSLIIADLERRGLVEKVKKGRGNIIFLKQTGSDS